MKQSVTLSLVSHTNVGKTTLARTLLRRDVGEVLDEAHVTDASEAYDLVATDTAVLRLWDTPGFGDTARLVRRVRHEGTSVGWVLHQVWDRFTNRALYCSQQAIVNVREQADVVLYLVNASEHPEDAGYVGHELELLTWMERPVLLLLNQTGDDSSGLEGSRELVRAWKALAARWPIVRDVFVLDAFTRCWVQEVVLLERVERALEGDLRARMKTLTAAWNSRNLGVFATCQQALVDFVAQTVPDAEPLGDKRGSERGAERALEKLARRLEERKGTLMHTLVEAHELSGTAVSKITASLDDVTGHAQGERPNTNVWAIVGAAATGALGGLAADLLAGGLTFGGGAVVGAIAGFLGGKSAGKVYDLVRHKGSKAVRWSPRFLDELLRDALLHYLAVAHFGRGRGDFRDVEQPAWWRAEVDRALDQRRPELTKAVSDPPDRDALRSIVDEALRSVLSTRYPEAHALLN